MEEWLVAARRLSCERVAATFTMFSMNLTLNEILFFFLKQLKQQGV